MVVGFRVVDGLRVPVTGHAPPHFFPVNRLLITHELVSPLWQCLAGVAP